MADEGLLREAIKTRTATDVEVSGRRNSVSDQRVRGGRHPWDWRAGLDSFIDFICDRAHLEVVPVPD
jgi:hypothetical protein